MKSKIIIFLFIQTLIWMSCSDYTGKVKPGINNLVSDFENPPGSTRPGAWWMWLNGNITEEGITHDLEAMKSKGMNRAEIFDINDNKYGTPELAGFFNVPTGGAFLGDESVKLIKHTLAEGKRLNMSIGIVGSSGWNFGGSWVTPDWASKALYFSDIAIEGPKTIEIDLPFPKVSERCPKNDQGIPAYYREVAILALPYNEKKTIENISRIVNLSSKFINGKLAWDVPEGKWSVMRFICSNTGQGLIAASPASRGLYVDFLDPEAIKRHLKYMLERLGITPENSSDAGLDYISEDSIEELSRQMLWTDLMGEIFKEKQGYDIISYLPVFAGWSIEGKTDRFLYDFKKTFSDQFIYSHYTKGSEFLKQYNIDLVAELGWSLGIYIDGVKAMGNVPVPRGVFWIRYQEGIPHNCIIKQVSSASHIYGKTLVDAESYTTWRKWKDSPFDLKKYADRAYCEGLNHVTLNNFTNTPMEDGIPGRICYAGVNINSANTWWGKSQPYMEYLSHCNYMLRQGLFVADVCYFYGDQGASFWPSSDRHIKPSLKGLGKGYDFDVVNSDVILNRMSVKNGRIVLPDGMSYAVMILPEQGHMPLAVLKKIMEMVKSGATIIGPRPTNVPNLKNYEKEEIKLNKLAARLWGEIDGKKVFENSFGKGRVFYGLTPEEVLIKIGIGKDFSFNGQPEPDYIHRTIETGEIYFISNRNDDWFNGICQFNVSGKYPELWDPGTGIQRSITNFNSENDKTGIRLELPPWGSVFVVFVKEKRANLEPAGIEEIIKTEEIGGSWKVTFPEGWGAPANTVFNELKSWTDFDDKGIKYFSGTAAYLKTILIDKEMIEKSANVVVDLGEVRDVAEVFINGKSAGILWKKPFSADITRLVKQGENELKVEVVNCWINRITGDMLSDPKNRYCRTNQPFNQTQSRLAGADEIFHVQTAGLVGPVKLIYATTGSK